MFIIVVIISIELTITIWQVVIITEGEVIGIIVKEVVVISIKFMIIMFMVFIEPTIEMVSMFELKVNYFKVII